MPYGSGDCVCISDAFSAVISEKQHKVFVRHARCSIVIAQSGRCQLRTCAFCRRSDSYVDLLIRMDSFRPFNENCLRSGSKCTYGKCEYEHNREQNAHSNLPSHVLIDPPRCMPLSALGRICPAGRVRALIPLKVSPADRRYSLQKTMQARDAIIQSYFRATPHYLP